MRNTASFLAALLILTAPSAKAVPVTAGIQDGRIQAFDGGLFAPSGAGTMALAKTIDTLLLGTFAPAGGFGTSRLTRLAIGADGVALWVNYDTGGTPAYFLQLAGGPLEVIGPGTYDLPDGGSFEIDGNSFYWRPATSEHFRATVTTLGVNATFVKDSDDESKGLFNRETELGSPTFDPSITEITPDLVARRFLPVILSASALNVFSTLPVTGEFLDYQWDVNGDGLFDFNGQTIEASFDSGLHDVRLRVTNNYGFFSERNVRITVPEPSILALLLAGLIPLLVLRRRRS